MLRVSFEIVLYPSCLIIQMMRNLSKKFTPKIELSITFWKSQTEFITSERVVHCRYKRVSSICCAVFI